MNIFFEHVRYNPEAWLYVDSRGRMKIKHHIPHVRGISVREWNRIKHIIGMKA